MANHPNRSPLSRAANAKFGSAAAAYGRGWRWSFRAEGQSRSARGDADGTLYSVRGQRDGKDGSVETKREVVGYIVA